MTTPTEGKKAWATLLTRTDYLAGKFALPASRREASWAIADPPVHERSSLLSNPQARS